MPRIGKKYQATLSRIQNVENRVDWPVDPKLIIPGSEDVPLVVRTLVPNVYIVLLSGFGLLLLLKMFG